MRSCHYVLFSALIVVCASQRSPYAGRRPIGYPEIVTTTTTTPASVQNDTLGNRLGESQNATTTTTQRLPLEALGDRDLVNRLGQVPQDNQPFWFINWQALEQQRQQPQSYPQRPSIFAQAAQTNQNPGQANRNTS